MLAQLPTPGLHGRSRQKRLSPSAQFGKVTRSRPTPEAKDAENQNCLPGDTTFRGALNLPLLLLILCPPNWGIVQWQDGGFWNRLSRFESLYPNSQRLAQAGRCCLSVQRKQRSSAVVMAESKCSPSFRRGHPSLILPNSGITRSRICATISVRLRV